MFRPHQSTRSIVFVSRTVVVLVVLATGLLSRASSQEFEQSRRAATLARQFKTDVERARIWAEGQAEEAEANFSADVGTLLDTYLEELAAIQQAETTEGNLEAAIEVRDAIAEVEAARDQLTALADDEAPVVEESPRDLQVQWNQANQRLLRQRLDALAGSVWKFNNDTFEFLQDGLVINNVRTDRPVLIPYADGFLVLCTPNNVEYIEFNANLTAATRYRTGQGRAPTANDTHRGQLLTPPE